MKHSTLAYLLRWHAVQLLFGLTLSALGVYGLTHLPSDPPGREWESLASVLLAFGLSLAWGAWHRASLRGADDGLSFFHRHIRLLLPLLIVAALSSVALLVALLRAVA